MTVFNGSEPIEVWKSQHRDGTAWYPYYRQSPIAMIAEIQKTNFPINSPIITEERVATIPGSMKL
jgi:hypothetical protein